MCLIAFALLHSCFILDDRCVLSYFALSSNLLIAYQLYLILKTKLTVDLMGIKHNHYSFLAEYFLSCFSAFKRATTCDFQQCGILTSVNSDEPVQPPFKLRNSKFCSVSSLTLMESLWLDCVYAQAGLGLCWSHKPYCPKSHVTAQIMCKETLLVVKWCQTNYYVKLSIFLIIYMEKSTRNTYFWNFWLYSNFCTRRHVLKNTIQWNSCNACIKFKSLIKTSGLSKFDGIVIIYIFMF